MVIYSVLIALAFATPTAAEASGQIGADTLAEQPEVLPDGNVRDPEPTAAALAQLVATSKRNLVALPAGTFDMGDWGPEVNPRGLPFDGPDSKPLHKVQLDAFSIGKFPVTYAEFDLFTAALRLPRVNQENLVKRYRKPSNPVGVTWEGARDYCRWLGRLTGASFDLPTEAQWEYSARSGGKRVRYPTDNGDYEPGRNLPTFYQKEDAGGLVAVDSFPPNPAGIYYMSAGVSEWVIDWYDAQYYERSPRMNPHGPEQGTVHVVRGHYGDGGSEMTFKRWFKESEEQTGTWTLYNKKTGHVIREIPFTKYSQTADSSFRCVLN